MQNFEKLKEIYKKVIDQASPLVEISLGEGKQFDKEKFMYLIEATKGLKEIQDLEIMKEGKALVYDYLDVDEEAYRDGKREMIRGYMRDGKRERVSGYYRNGRMMMDDYRREYPYRYGKTEYVDRTYRVDDSGMYLEDEVPSRMRSFDESGLSEQQYYDSMNSDSRDGRSSYNGQGSYNRGSSNYSNRGNSNGNTRNYRFKHKYKDEYDTEIEEEIYKIIENKPEEQQTETIEKIINILAEPINDMKITYPRIYDKVINKIKVMK